MASKISPPIASIEVKGRNGVTRRLFDMGRRAEDARPVWPKISALLVEAEKARFSSKGGGSWPALKPETMQAKQALGRNPNILRSSDALYRSLTSATGSDAVRKKTPTEFSFGTSVFYARFHQSAKRLPQRKVLDFDEKTLVQTKRILLKHIIGS